MSKLKREFNNIGRLVKVNREEKGLSQTQLSKVLGYKNGQFISNVERGICSIPFEKIGTLSNTLEVAPIEVKKAILLDMSTTIDTHLGTVSEPATPVANEGVSATTTTVASVSAEGTQREQ